MKFTRSGWYDRRSKTTYMLQHSRGRNGKTKFTVAIEKRPMLAPVFIKHSAENAELPSIGEFLNLLYNVSRGQRATTPKYQNQFMDRYDKTFFREGTRFTMDANQETVTNLCAFANYVVISRDNGECGMVEPLYDGYRYLVGNLAYTLYHLLNEQEEYDCSCPIFEEDKKSNLGRLELTEKKIKAIQKKIKTVDDAAEFVEGCFLVCFMHDHATTGKDLSNAKLRAIVDKIAPYIEELSSPVIIPQNCDDESKLVTVLSPGAMNAIKNAGKAGISEIWVISSECDEIIDFLGDDKERVLAEFRERKKIEERERKRKREQREHGSGYMRPSKVKQESQRKAAASKKKAVDAKK